MTLAEGCAARWESGDLTHLFVAMGAGETAEWGGTKMSWPQEEEREVFDTGSCWVLHGV